MSELPRYLYKYYSDNKQNTDVLADGKVFYAHPLLLNDPFDCQLKVNTLLPEDEIPKAIEQAIQDGLALGAKKKGHPLRTLHSNTLSLQLTYDHLVQDLLGLIFNLAIFSTSDDGQNPLMWSHYASSYKGFVVRFDTLEPNSKKLADLFRPVNYKEEIPAVTLEEIASDEKTYFSALLTKSIGWSYEREWRGIVSPGSALVPIPFKIDQVYFGFRAKEELRKRAMVSLGNDIEVFYAIPDTDKFKVKLYNGSDGYRYIHPEGIVFPFRPRMNYNTVSHPVTQESSSKFFESIKPFTKYGKNENDIKP